MFQSRFMELDGHRIHYTDEGPAGGPVLLFATAGAAWSFVYRDVIDALSDTFRCIALDVPGSGLSEGAPGYRPSMEGSAAVFEAFVKASTSGT